MSTRTSTKVLPATGGGVITRSVLPGGLRLITEAMPGVRSVSVGVWVGVGSRDEAPTVAGASHFLEHLLFKGTRSRSGLEIAMAMDAVGGEFNAFTEKEHTCYYATVLDDELPMAVDMICDVVLNAVISAADVEVERAVVLEEISMRDDDPSDLVHDEFSSAMFGDAPLGRPILGTEESINGLTRAQIFGFYSRRYHPSEMVVAVAGNVAHDTVLALVKRAFAGRLTASETPTPVRSQRVPRSWRPTPLHVINDDTEQANIVLGVPGLARLDPRRFVLSVLSAAVGGGMSSRLFQQIREERGLAYSTYSFTSAYSGAGVFGMYAGCQPGKADEVISIMTGVLEDIAVEGISDDEIVRAKGQLRGGMVLGLEDSGSRMSRIGKAELSYGDVLGLDQLLAEVDSVTPERVNALCREIATGKRCLTVVGPFSASDFATSMSL